MAWGADSCCTGRVAAAPGFAQDMGWSMKQLDRLTHPAAPRLPEDAQGVIDAAWTLRISEFDLFRLAHRRWYHREAEEKALEAVFARYLFRQEAPPWVRQYYREVLARAAAGTLDPKDFGADTVRRREPVMQYPRKFIAMTMAVMLLGYLIYVWLG
jgi:hypothetical protein